MWGVHVLQSLFSFPLYHLGIYPREVWGIKGILFAPFLHGDFNHLISNSLPILVLGFGLFYFFRDQALRVFVLLFFSTNILLWVIGRPSYHIGASGLIYALASWFLTVSFLFRNRQLGAYALVIIFLYGGLIWGVLPQDTHVSWEGHLSGAISGLIWALVMAPNLKNDEIMQQKPQKNSFRYDFIEQNTTLDQQIEIHYIYKNKDEKSNENES